jgi:hypothetical protein
MGPFGENTLWCPDALASCWWQPFLIDGYVLEKVIDPGLGNWTYGQPPDVLSSADLTNSRLIIVGQTKIQVIVFRDVECTYDHTKSLWLTYFSNTDVDGWVSRVLLASGAKLGGCRGCKCLFSCSSVSWSPPRERLEKLGSLSAGLRAPDKFAFAVSREGVSVNLYFGKHVDYRTEEIRTYAAIDYQWRLFRRGALEKLVGDLSQSLLSLDYEHIDIGSHVMIPKGSS